MKDKSALRPVFTPIKPKPVVEDIKTLTEEEQVLAAGSVNKFWAVLKKQFENSILTLEQVNEQAIANGLPLEEIGRNAIVLNQVKGVLRGIINKVDDAKEMEDERGATK